MRQWLNWEVKAEGIMGVILYPVMMEEMSWPVRNGLRDEVFGVSLDIWDIELFDTCSEQDMGVMFDVTTGWKT